MFAFGDKAPHNKRRSEGRVSKPRLPASDMGLLGDNRWQSARPMTKFPMTAAGYSALQDELNQRMSVTRPRLIQRMQEAIADDSNLAENSEYHAAQADKLINEARIVELEDKLAHAEVIDVSKLSGDTIKFGATALRSIRRSATSAHAARWTNARSAPAALKPTSARKSMRNTAPTAWRRWRSKPLPLTPDSASYAASPIADQSTMRRCHSIGRATTTTGHCYRSHSSSGASPLNRPKSVPQDRLTHSCGSTCRHRRPRN